VERAFSLLFVKFLLLIGIDFFVSTGGLFSPDVESSPIPGSHTVSLGRKEVP